MYESSIVRKAQHAATTDVRKSFIRRSHQLHVRRRDVIRMVGVKSLLVGQSFGQVGDAATSMVTAQMLLFVNSDASVRTSLFTSIGMMLPVLVLAGPLAGVLVDRLNRRGILVYGHFLRGILVISLMWASILFDVMNFQPSTRCRSLSAWCLDWLAAVLLQF